MGVAKPGLPLKEMKEKLDSVAGQLASYRAQDVTGEKFWALRKQWEWLNTTKAELNKEAKRELFSVPRSDVCIIGVNMTHYHQTSSPKKYFSAVKLHCTAYSRTVLCIFM